MSGYRQPVFLADRDEPRLRLRCPIHGFIRFSENERDVVDHPLYQRLRYIRQLALTEYVYPGASHTRFEHSLGVMELASRGFDSLAAKRGGLMELSFSQLDDFQEKPMAKARQVLRLAALLHDTGHASFSHAAEDVVFNDKAFGHEALSVAIIGEERFLGTLLTNIYWSECPKRVAQLIKGGPELPPQLSVLRNLVSGQMDADRVDYLLRDSHHCGVDYGKFDYRRLFESLTLIEGELGGLEIALDKGGIHTFEAMILARYQMNSQVYFHRLRRIYDLYLKEYHRCLDPEEFRTAEGILAQNDMTMMARIMHDARTENGLRSVWARRIAGRKHHKLVHETSVDANAEDVLRSKKLYVKLRERFADVDFRWDLAESNIHKLLRPDDQKEEGYVRLSVVEGNGAQRQVGEVSQVFRTIPRAFQCARIFGNSDEIGMVRRMETEAFAREQWREMGGR